MNFFNRFRRCYYTITKEVLEDQVPYKRQRYLRDIFLLIYILRVFPIVFFAYYDTNHRRVALIKQYDPLVNFFALKRTVFEPFMVIVAFLFALFDFVCQRGFYRLNVKGTTWQWWYQLVVSNQDAYYSARITNAEQLGQIYRSMEARIKANLVGHSRNYYLNDVLLSYTLPKMFIKLIAGIRIYDNFENVNQKKLYGRRLKINPQLSNVVRRKVLKFLIIGDYVGCLLLLLVVSLFFALYLTNALTYDASSHPWYSMLLVHLDITIAYFVVTRMCQSALFFTISTILGTIVATYHSFEFYNYLTSLITKYSATHSRTLPLIHLPAVYRHLKAHNRVCTYIALYSCKELFGTILLAFLVTHLPVNVYLLRRNILLSHSIITDTIPWVIFFFQSAAALVVFVPLAWGCEVMHKPKRVIPKLLLLMVHPGWRWCRLKYDDLHNRLLQGPKLAISVGDMKAITYYSAFEFLLIYVAYVLIAFSQIIQANLKMEDLRSI